MNFDFLSKNKHFFLFLVLLSLYSSSAVAICVGEAERKDLVRRDATSRTRHPPPVVPDFVISEKQVLRFFGHLSEGDDCFRPMF